MQGDLGDSSSGYGGSSIVSSSVSGNLFKPDVPLVSNFPLCGSPLSYPADPCLPPSPLVPTCLDQSRPTEEEQFSEDSLTESPGKRSRVTKRLEELAQQIDNEDSLANIDSLISAAQYPDVNKEIGPDSLIPVRHSSCSILEADSLEDFRLSLSDPREIMDQQLAEIDGQIKDIETRQLLSQLESLQQEISRLGSSDHPPRAQWTAGDVSLATTDLSDNKITKFSYEDVGRDELLETRRLSTQSSLSCVTDIDSSDPPRPQRASLPSPVPNTRAILAARREREAGKTPVRPLVEHSGAVGVRSLWIPAGPSRPRLRIQKTGSSSSSNISNKNSQKRSVRDNGAIGKKLQIQNLSILPNKAEGSQSWHEGMLLSVDVRYLQLLI